MSFRDEELVRRDAASVGGRVRVAHVVAVLLLFVALNVACVAVAHFARVRGEYPQLALFDVRYAEAMLARDTWVPPTGYYPPAISWMLVTVARVTGAMPEPFWFNGVLINVGFVAWVCAARVVTGSLARGLFVGWLTLANVYFIAWAMRGRDTAAEFATFAVFAWLLAALLRARGRVMVGLAVAASVAAVLCGLTRVTGFFVTSGLGLAAFLLHPRAREMARDLVAVRGALLLVFAAPFVGAVLLCQVNEMRFDAYTLATSGGYNLYIGNHPDYLKGHPDYDIDAFFERERFAVELADLPSADGSQAAGEGARDRALTRLAVRAMVDDPVGFLWRTTLKTVWHFAALEKIPRVSGAAWIDATSDEVHREGAQSRWPGVPYLVWRVVTLGLVLCAVWRMARGGVPGGEFAMWFAPLFALWPVVALTFADTRFKFVGELAMLVPGVALLPDVTSRVAVWLRPRARRG